MNLKQRFLDALPDDLAGRREVGHSDETKELLAKLKAGVLEAFEATTPGKPPLVTIQDVTEGGKTTHEVVDRTLPKHRRIVASGLATREAAEKERQKYARTRFVRGGSYVLAAVDTDEPFHDTDYEIVGNMHLYGVVSGCALSYDASDMTVDLAAGVILHNGVPVAVSTQANGYTLVSDGSNERWTALTVNSSGTATLVSGDAAANASTEPTKPEIGDRVLVGFAKIQASQTIANDVEYQLDKRVMTHRLTTVEGPLVPLHGDGFAQATLQLNSNTTMSVGVVSIPHRITVTQLTIRATTIGTAGTLGLALFSNDGQTRWINETTASISGAGGVSVVLSSPVTLEPGMYYFAVNPDGTADVTVASWDTFSAISATAGYNEMAGTVTVSAGAIPTTFDPDAGVTSATDRCVWLRLN